MSRRTLSPGPTSRSHSAFAASRRALAAGGLVIGALGPAASAVGADGPATGEAAWAGQPPTLAAPPDAGPPAAPLVTDRPDFTESTATVPRGRAQLEAGYTWTDGDGFEQHAVGEALLRIGLADEWELRLEAPSYAWTRGDDQAEGLTDAGVGFKLHLLDQRGPRPDLAVIGSISLPAGAGGLSSDTTDPAATLAWAYDLSELLSLAGNFNGALVDDDRGERFLEPSASLALGLGLTDRLGVFVEYFGFYGGAAGHGRNAHYADGGLTFLLRPDLQVDARVGVGLGGGADDAFAGVGLAVRW